MSKKNKFTVPKENSKKEFGGGTMTKAAFWQGIRSALRQKSRWWFPIQECKKLARRAYKGANKRQKFEYLCSSCKNWFPDKECRVDHKQECGQLSSPEDLPGFVMRLFCEVDGLQVLCSPCHDIKTQEYKQKLKEEKEKNEEE